MSTQEASRYCKHCGKQVLVRRASTNHVLHLLLSIVTCGVWLPIWILGALCNQTIKWRCTHCGSQT